MAWWHRDPSTWCRSPLHRYARRALRENEAQLCTIRLRCLSQTPSYPAWHNDEYGKRPSGLSELEWIQLQHCRRWKRRLEEDPYHALFGASNDMLGGKGLTDLNWAYKAFPKWMLKEMDFPESQRESKARESAGRGWKDESSEKKSTYTPSSPFELTSAAVPSQDNVSSYPQKVNISSEEPSTRKGASTSKAKNAVKPDYSIGVVSPSDPRRPRDNVIFEPSNDVGNFEPGASWNTEATPSDEVVLRKGSHHPDTPMPEKNFADEGVRISEKDAAVQKGSTFIKEFLADSNTIDQPESSSEPASRDWRQTVLDRRVSPDYVSNFRKDHSVSAVEPANSQPKNPTTEDGTPSAGPLPGERFSPVMKSHGQSPSEAPAPIPSSQSPANDCENSVTKHRPALGAEVLGMEENLCSVDRKIDLEILPEAARFERAKTGWNKMKEKGKKKVEEKLDVKHGSVNDGSYGSIGDEEVGVTWKEKKSDQAKDGEKAVMGKRISGSGDTIDSPQKTQNDAKIFGLFHVLSNPLDTSEKVENSSKKTEDGASKHTAPSFNSSRSTSDILSQLPKDDMDFLSASDIRASMGIKRSSKDSTEESEKMRKRLKDDFVVKHNKEQELAPTIESKVMNDQHVRRTEKELREKVKEVTTELALETSLDRMIKLEPIDAYAFAETWTDAMNENNASTGVSTEILKDIASHMQRSHNMIQMIREELKKHFSILPFGIETVSHRLSGYQGEVIARTDRLLRDLEASSNRTEFAGAPSNKNEMTEEIRQKKLQKLRIEIRKTDTELDEVWKLFEETIGETVQDNAIERATSNSSVRRALRRHSRLLWKNLRLTNTMSYSVLHQLETIGEHPSERLFWDITDTLVVLEDTYLAFLTIIGHTLQSCTVGFEQTGAKFGNTAAQGISEKNAKLDAKPVRIDDLVHSSSPRFAEFSRHATVDRRFEEEIHAQKAAMQGFSDDGCSRAPKPSWKTSLDEPSPLMHSLFRPFGQQLESLGKDAETTAAHGSVSRFAKELAAKRQQSLNDRALVQEIKEAYEDVYGRITTHHQQRDVDSKEAPLEVNRGGSKGRQVLPVGVDVDDVAVNDITTDSATMTTSSTNKSSSSLDSDPSSMSSTTQHYLPPIPETQYDAIEVVPATTSTHPQRLSAGYSQSPRVSPMAGHQTTDESGPSPDPFSTFGNPSMANRKMTGQQRSTSDPPPSTRNPGMASNPTTEPTDPAIESSLSAASEPKVESEPRGKATAGTVREQSYAAEKRSPSEATDPATGSQEAVEEPRTMITYKVLAYDPSTDAVTVTNIESSTISTSTTTTSIPLPEALQPLRYPAKFLPKLPTGFDIVSASPNILVLCEPSEPSTSIQYVKSVNEKELKEEEWRRINPVDGTTRLSPTGYVGVDDFKEEVGRELYLAQKQGGERKQREGQSNSEGSSRGGEKGRRGGGVASVLKTGIVAVAGCYVVGVIGELLT